MSKGFDEHKPIRNKLRNYKKEELLVSLMLTSCKTSRASPESWAKGLVPWELLLMGKWLIADWDNINGNKTPTHNEFVKLVNLLKKFLDKMDPLLAQAGGIKKFMRRTAFQQFWHQKSLSGHGAGRAIKLLIDSKLSDNLDARFEQTYGLSRLDIAEITLLIWSGFYGDDNNLFLKTDFFIGIQKTMPSEKLTAYFKLFSLHIEEIEVFSKSLSSPKSYLNEVFERTPFLSKPYLFDRQSRILLWSGCMLTEIIEHGVYDLMKRMDSGAFGDQFGTLFEQYIESQLNEYKLKYIVESELKKLGFQNQVDFFLETEEDAIFIEAKGIEASRLTQVLPLDEIMYNSYKGNIVKAIFQAHSVYKKMKVNGCMKTPYLLVVSYKELYLGDGVDAWDEFASEALKNVYGVDIPSIPVENIFFLSVESFDKFLVCLDGKIENAGKVLKMIVEKKKDIYSKRFIFSQYLEDFAGIKLSDRRDTVLVTRFNKFHQDVIEKHFPGQS